MSDTFLPGSGFDTYEQQDKVLVGLGGGTAAKVAVRILQQQGFAVAGAVVKLSAEEEPLVQSAKEAAKALGIECATLNAEALAAQADGADYLGCGAAFVTGTKLDAHPVTAETMRAVTAAVNIPVVAIGGIDAANLLQLQGRGLAGVAVVSAIFAQADPCAASRELYRLAGQL